LIAPADMQTQLKKPVVSVVMVVCNVDRFLAEAIEGILGQTFREFEFIIVDFGSSDKSKEIISSYAAKDSRIKLHEIPHCGLTEARNAGCFRAQGRYIAVQDADDISLPQRLLWQVEFMEKHPQVGVVGGEIEWIDATGKILENSVLPYAATLNRPHGNREIQSALLSSCPFWEAVLLRSEAFFRVGGYRSVFVQSEDYDLYMRISEQFEMANLAQVTFQYRIHPHQVSVRKRKEQTLCSLAVRASAALRRNGNPDPLNSAKEITPELLAGLGISEADLQSALANEYRGWIHNLCGAGEWATALNAAMEMLKSSDWKYIKRRTLADMRLEVAGVYWKNNRFLMSMIIAGHAVITRPMLAGRPLKPWLQRLGLVRSEVIS
jgi:glycosyltransferase involved in cell wall biosynthesis